MKNVEKFLIDGQWIAPDSTAQHYLINPANEDVICQIPMANEVDVNKAVAAAKSAFQSYSMTSREERLESLGRKSPS